MKKQSLIIIATALLLSGCGSMDRGWSKLTGSATETCIDGITYLQFTTGSTVKIDKATMQPELC